VSDAVEETATMRPPPPPRRERGGEEEFGEAGQGDDIHRDQADLLLYETLGEAPLPPKPCVIDEIVHFYPPSGEGIVDLLRGFGA